VNRTLGWGVLVLALFMSMGTLWAADAQESPDTKSGKVRYRGAREINFEKLLIEGELKRKQITVVTGNAPDGTDGLLRLRENFLDRVAMDAGEEVP
jgi:hypothetical protein